MVITFPTQAHSFAGIRPIDLNKDIPQVLRLLEVVFGRRLGNLDGQRLAGGFDTERAPAILWRVTPGASQLALGFVWEQDDRIVGNITVLNTRTQGRFLIVNVAVHPDFRRQGIARHLMEAAARLVANRKGNEILLQVENDNEGAIKLYEDLGFRSLGKMTTWRSAISRVRPLTDNSSDTLRYSVRELDRREWQAAYELDLTSLSPELNWPESLPPDTYRGGIWRWIENLFSGRHSEVWVAADDQGRLNGLAGLWSEWGRSYRLKVRIHPAMHGKLEQILLSKVVRRLQYLPRRSVRIDHPTDDAVMNDLLAQANFSRSRTLTHMRLYI